MTDSTESDHDKRTSTGDSATGGDGDGDGTKRSRRRRRGRRGRGGTGGSSVDKTASSGDATGKDAGDDTGAGDGSKSTPTSGSGRSAGRRARGNSNRARRGSRRSSANDGAENATASGGAQDQGDARGGDGAGSDSDKRAGDSGGSRGANRRGDKGSGNSDNAGKGNAKGAGDGKGNAKRTGGGKGNARRSGGSKGSGGRGGSTRLDATRNRSGGRRNVQGVSEDVRRALRDGPPKTMLVSVDETRTQIAVVEDRTLVEYHVTDKSASTLVGNIYMARVQNVLPGMEAAFLDIGRGRNGVLYAGEVLYDDLDIEEGASPRIEDALKPGQKVLVQVTKDAMGTKGPRLTMQLSLAGRYTVLAPHSTVFGISRKLTDKERDRLRKAIKKVKPSEHGVIVRTNAEDIPGEQLEADLGRLLKRWDRIEERAATAKALTSVYEEPPLHVKVVRDSFGADYVGSIIDDPEVYDAVAEYLAEVTADEAEKVALYGPARWEREHPDSSTDVERPRFAPLFDAYNVTDQLRQALSRKVWLPSGGYLIIESTEAMKVIDVNTGKYTGSKKSNLEEVVFKTNLEAADEIVRQLRLRDMGGIIVIDFIDMLQKANQDQVVSRLKHELLRDKTKTRVSEVSRLGLVQMTRKNVSHGLLESFGHRCEHCDGTGWTTEF